MERLAINKTRRAVLAALIAMMDEVEPDSSRLTGPG